MRQARGLFLAFLLGCGADSRPVVYLSVEGSPAEARWLRAQAMLEGTPGSAAEFSEDLDQLSVRLPGGARGDLRITVKALAADRCVLADAQTVVRITGDRLHRSAVALAAVATSTCPDLHVRVEGEGRGVVRSDPPGIDCGLTCQAALPSGTRVVLQPQPDRRSYFDGWSGGCTGSGACEIVVGPEVPEVRARFHQQICSSAGWCWEDPLPQGNALYGLYGTGPTDIYAVGEAGTILHHDGTGWAGMKSGTRLPLQSIWGSDPSHVFIAGGELSAGVVLQLDGRTWRLAYSPPAVLLDIGGASASEVYAISAAAVHRFDGVGWSVQAQFKGEETALTALWAIGPQALWLGAWTLDRPGTLLLGDGKVFQNKAVWPQGILAFWGASEQRVYASGERGMALFFDGQAWSRMSTQIEEDLNGIRGIGDEVLAVGNRGRALRLEGASFRPMETGTEANLRAVWGSDPAHTFAVGDGVMLMRDGARWTPFGRHVNRAPDLLSGTAADNVVIVSQDRSVVRWTGASFHDLGSPLIRGINGLWTEGPQAIIVVGDQGAPDRGAISRWDGKAWQLMPTFTDRQLTAVWGSTRSGLVVVADDGTTRRWDGSWQMATGPGCGLRAAFQRTPEEVYGLCGASARIWSSGHWSATTPAGAQLRGVWAAGLDRVFVVGDQGTFARWDGFSLRPLGCAAAEDLLAVWGSSEINVYAAGKNGLLLRWDGARCEVLDSGTTQEIRALWGSSANEIFAATEGGVLRHRP